MPHNVNIVSDIELKNKLLDQSNEALKKLIIKAEHNRKKKTPTNYLESYLKKAKQHII